MRERVRSRMRQTGRAGLMMLGLILSAGCAPQAGSGTEVERSICRELRADLPSWSRYDTPETLSQGARFVTVFGEVCNQ